MSEIRITKKEKNTEDKTMATHQYTDQRDNYRRMSGEDEMMFTNASPFQANVSTEPVLSLSYFIKFLGGRIFRI